MQSLAAQGNKFVGFKQSKRAIESGNATKAFIAEDCAFEMRQSLELLCKKHNVSVEFVPTMQQLGAQCGISVGAAVAVISPDGKI
ncbi:MAG: ribosomal L7Ae/L30e/S12e/Gadd45 family protein [Firmicutes bacterium]|nr:ribosomal L7Ae/L30e/S12e/Gadd45 family protein [Bacillota bacterium]